MILAPTNKALMNEQEENVLDLIVALTIAIRMQNLLHAASCWSENRIELGTSTSSYENTMQPQRV